MTSLRHRTGQALVLLLVAFAIRSPLFGNPVIHSDEQFYLLVGDRLLHLASRAGAHPCATVQYPVDGALAQSRLHGKSLESAWMAHSCSWRVFGGFLALTRRFCLLG